MPTKLNTNQRQRVYDALSQSNGYGQSDAALWAAINAGEWDAHPAAGKPQGAPRKAKAKKGKPTSIYPTTEERDLLDARRGNASRTDYLLTQAGIRS